MAEDWTTIRIRTARKQAVAARAAMAGVSAAEWADQALAVALAESTPIVPAGALEVGAPSGVNEVTAGGERKPAPVPQIVRARALMPADPVAMKHQADLNKMRGE